MLTAINNLENIKKEIATLAKQEVELIVVSKNISSEHIIPLLQHGHRIFAESKIQEAQAKWNPLKEIFPDVKLHLIGHLQSNKIKDAVKIFDVIQTIDRLSLAEKIADHMNKSQILRDCYIQVNTGEEPQKSGISPILADNLIMKCINLGIPIKGLMCIPPLDKDPCLHFTLLKEIATRHNLTSLSMGMSNDYKIALQCGATHVRIGSAIFGNRK